MAGNKLDKSKSVAEALASAQQKYPMLRAGQLIFDAMEAKYNRWFIESTGKTPKPVLDEIIKRANNYPAVTPVRTDNEGMNFRTEFHTHIFHCLDSDLIAALDNFEENLDWLRVHG